jgi:hypothetical protein
MEQGYWMGRPIPANVKAGWIPDLNEARLGLVSCHAIECWVVC